MQKGLGFLNETRIYLAAQPIARQSLCRPFIPFLTFFFHPPYTSLLMFKKLSRLSRPWLIFLAITAWLLFMVLSFILAYSYARSVAANDGVEIPTLWQFLFGY